MGCPFLAVSRHSRAQSERPLVTPKRTLRILVAVEIDETQCSAPELQAERRKA